MTVFDIVEGQIKDLESRTGYILNVILDDDHTTGWWPECVREINFAMKHCGFKWHGEVVEVNGRFKEELNWSIDTFENKRQIGCGEDGYFYPALTFALETLKKRELLQNGEANYNCFST